jgi:uncharacterized protein (TIGR03067 family)
MEPIMRRKFLFLLVGFLAAPMLHGSNDEPKGTPLKEEKQKLQGIWQVTKLIDSSENPAPADEIKDYTVTFEGDRVIMQKTKDDGRLRQEFTIDPSKKPKWIDIGVVKDLPIGEGIYKLEGNELFICVVSKTNSDSPTLRPSEFKAKKEQHTLLVLKKVKT